MSNSNSTDILAVSAIIIAWLIYRLGVWSQRVNVLRGVKNELELHGAWVDHEYTDQATYDPSWKEPGYVVFKLSTVAIDNAIAQGPGLFLNSNLSSCLIGYRQRVNQFNQLVELAANYQCNVDLWRTDTPDEIKKRMRDLTCLIHWYGIGDNKNQFTYYYFQLVRKELQKETKSKVLSVIWILTNINIFWLKDLLHVSIEYL